VSTGGTGLRFSPEIGGEIPANVLAEIAELEAKIVSGELAVPTSEEEYNALLGK
jgi:Uncharacterized ABC-type transport system, periplasmic component/surface lipoprotein